MHFPCIAGFHYKTGLCADAFCHQVLMHCANRQQRRDGCKFIADLPVRQNQDLLSGANGFLGFGANAVDAFFQTAGLDRRL